MINNFKKIALGGLLSVISFGVFAQNSDIHFKSGAYKPAGKIDVGRFTISSFVF